MSLSVSTSSLAQQLVEAQAQARRYKALYEQGKAIWREDQKTIASLHKNFHFVDRSDAVNLARNLLEVRDCKGVTEKGVRTLAQAVLAMDAALMGAVA